MKSKKIVIVDDEKVVVEVLTEALVFKGFEVHSAPDGDSGLKLIQQVQPGLIMVDILMPKKDGLAFCKQLRQDSSLGHIPIILMTGVYRDIDFRIYQQNALVDDFITKPVQIDELWAKIERLL